MSNRTIRLSGDELAYTLAQAGRPDLGQGILQGTTDIPLSSEDAMQRLLAAGHGLLARQLLTIDAEARPVLGADLAWVTGVLIGASFSLRYSLATARAAFTLTYHRTATGVVEHTVEQGVVHVFTASDGVDAVLDGGVAFFQLAGLRGAPEGEGVLPQALLEAAQAAGNVQAARATLMQAGLPAELSGPLAEDLASASRGSALRIEYGPGGEATAERGLLLLRGPARLWVLRPQQRAEGTLITVLVGTEATFRHEIALLLQ